MTPVKPQISKSEAERSCQVGCNVSRGSTHQRLLGDLSRSYMLAYYLSAFVLLATECISITLLS
jgi:hypothetical protein